ncbi:MAG: YceI family protein [Flavobacteriales bacterium]|nr:YceI family protein [Flavobacteriales bacterium]
MKSIILSLCLFSTTLMSAQSTIDPAASKVMWTATKVTGDHTGSVPVKSGTITATNGILTAAEVVIDMTGVTCLDIDNEGANAKFVAHLKGGDFFDVEKHATATFVTKSIEPIPNAAPGKPNYKVTGDLTIKGITKPNTFNCLFWMDNGTARAAASLTFDRTQYEIKYRSGTFIPDLGDKVIADEVSLTFDVSAK